VWLILRLCIDEVEKKGGAESDLLVFCGGFWVNEGAGGFGNAEKRNGRGAGLAQPTYSGRRKKSGSKEVTQYQR